jgi:hypothetical protein
VLVSGLQHHLAQFPFILAVLGHLHLHACILPGLSRRYIARMPMLLLKIRRRY